jgi:hypothetical protein
MSGILLMSVGNSYGALPVNTVAPAVTGTATVGSTLTTTNGTWTGAPAPTFTYQWQRSTVDISGQTASTYVIQSADAGLSVRCVVTATNSVGAVSANSNNTSIPLTIGQVFGGGFYAGQISTTGNSVADYNLVIGPIASTQSTLQWKTTRTSTAGTSSDIDGPANSAAMNNASHPAAQFCEGLTVGGFSDWYMPARNELDVCYFNLKPTTQVNDTNSGINANAVPARASNYTTGTPAQTSAANFVTSTGAEAFNGNVYWTSTELTAADGKTQRMYNGQFSYERKDNSYRVRAVRRVAV